MKETTTESEEEPEEYSYENDDVLEAEKPVHAAQSSGLFAAGITVMAVVCLAGVLLAVVVYTRRKKAEKVMVPEWENDPIVKQPLNVATLEADVEMKGGRDVLSTDF